MTTKRRPSIGRDPLDNVLPAPRPAPETAATKAPPPRKPPRRPRTPSVGKVEPETSPDAGRMTKTTYNVRAALVEECRNAVHALGGAPVHLTLAGLVDAALRRELDRLRKTHNAGRPFDGSGEALRGGRPLK